LVPVRGDDDGQEYFDPFAPQSINDVSKVTSKSKNTLTSDTSAKQKLPTRKKKKKKEPKF